MNLSRFGRSFSVLKVPYAFKLLIQELQVMNVQMRIITEDNVDQLLSMSFSDNINKLMKSDKSIDDTIKDYNENISNKLKVKEDRVYIVSETPEMPYPANIETPEFSPKSPEFSPHSPEFYNQPHIDSLFDIGDEVTVRNDDLGTYFPAVIQSKYSDNITKEVLYIVLYGDGDTERDVHESRIRLYKKKTPVYVPNSPVYVPNSPEYKPISPPLDSNTPPPSTNTKSDTSSKSSILEIEPPIEEKTLSDSSTSVSSISEPEKSNSEGESKKIIISKSDSESSDTTTSSGIKKITL
jgi:hypothetical protein